MHKYPYPCELYQGGCTHSPCDGLAEVPDIAIPKDDDTIVYCPRCYKLQPPLMLSLISESEFMRAMRGEFGERPANGNPQAEQTTPSTATVPAEDGSNTKQTANRHKGRSIYDGKKVHQDIESDSRRQFIKVNSRKFKLTRPMDWAVADQVLKTVQDRDDGYVIDLKADEYNALSNGGKDFVRHCIERQPLEKPIRGKKYTGKARIRPGLLRPNQL